MNRSEACFTSLSGSSQHDFRGFTLKVVSHKAVWACLVPHLKTFHLSYRIFGYIHGILNIDRKKLHGIVVNWKTELLSLFST